jgi:DNA polymerase V
MILSNVFIGEQYKKLSSSLDGLLDFNNACFIGRASGRSMESQGIFHGDLLLIDRSKTVKHNDVIVACYNNLFVCKIADLKNNQLLSASPDYPPVKITEFDYYTVEGVVTSSIRLHKLPPELLNKF